MTPSTPSKYPHRRKLYTPGTKVSDMDPWRERYSLKQICAFVTLSTGFQAPDEGTEKYRAEGTVLCVRGFVFLGVCCLFEIGAGLSRVRMPPLMIACSSISGAPTVFKCVWHVLDATLDQPGTAMQTRLRPGAQATGVNGTPAPNLYFGDGGRIHSAEGGRSLRSCRNLARVPGSTGR